MGALRRAGVLLWFVLTCGSAAVHAQDAPAPATSSIDLSKLRLFTDAAPPWTPLATGSPPPTIIWTPRVGGNELPRWSVARTAVFKGPGGHVFRRCSRRTRRSDAAVFLRRGGVVERRVRIRYGPWNVSGSVEPDVWRQVAAADHQGRKNFSVRRSIRAGGCSRCQGSDQRCSQLSRRSLRHHHDILNGEPGVLPSCPSCPSCLSCPSRLSCPSSLSCLSRPV